MGSEVAALECCLIGLIYKVARRLFHEHSFISHEVTNKCLTENCIILLAGFTETVPSCRVRLFGSVNNIVCLILILASSQF